MPMDRYTPQYRVREDIVDSIEPYNLVQDKVEAPAGEWRPAAWLPVVWTQYNTEAGSDAFVISTGKPVAFAGSEIVPAGLKIKLGGTGYGAGAAAATVLTYTPVDGSYKVLNLVTGQYVAEGVTINYTGAQVANALIERGLIDLQEYADAGGSLPASTDAHVRAAIDNFISQPVGIITSNVFVYAGTPERGDQRFHNYNKQHLVMFRTEHQMRMPHAGLQVMAAESWTANGMATEVYSAGEFVNLGEYWNTANVGQISRYKEAVAANPHVVAIGLGSGTTFGSNVHVAKNTDRTPISCSRSGVLVRERPALSLVTKEGDWFLDEAHGVLFLNQATWVTLVGAGVAVTFGYSYYMASPTNTSRFLYFAGPAKPGDFVTIDKDSNFRRASTAEIAAGLGIVGRVLEIQSQPQTGLEKVKTAWEIDGMSAASRMPGSATKGFGDLITHAEAVVADQLVVVNVRI